MKKTISLIVCFLILIAGSIAFYFISTRETRANAKVTEYVLSQASAEDLIALDRFPNLTSVDLRGSDCYEEIIAYIQAHPDVAVQYDISLAGMRLAPDTAELTLEEGSFTLDALKAAIPQLPKLRALSLPRTGLSIEALEELHRTFPDVALSYSIVVLDQEIPWDASRLDLSQLEANRLDATAEQLAYFPELTHIELMSPDGTGRLTPTDVRKIMDAAPDVTVNYTFDLFGKTVSVSDERVEFINQYIGNEGMDQIRAALDILPNCTYFLMDTCGVDDEIMAQLREDYQPRTKVVWRIWLEQENYKSKLMLRCGSYLTDTHRVRTTHVNNKNAYLLGYCTETKYLDIGHLPGLKTCEFLAYMPDLEVCIIAITGITDITPLANHEKLEYLELFTTDIEDLSPLASCPNLEHLNISNMPKVKDISPLYGLTKLKRVRGVDSPLIPKAQWKEFAEMVPGCTLLNHGHFATAWFWRYLDGASTVKDPRYALLCEQMEYYIDAVEYGIP